MYSPEYVESDEDDSDEEMLNHPQLPSLLSHLSLSGTFNTSSDSQSPPFDLTPAPSYNSRPGNSINLFGEDKRNRSTSPSSRVQKVDGVNQDKRRVGMEFQNRTKKAKLNHRYFRSQDLLSPPHQQHQSVASTSRQVTPSTSRVPSLTSSKNTTPTSSSASSLLHKPVIPSRLSTSSTLPAKSSPAWWPSVSLSSGEGRVSRFAPRESQFVGDGKGWIDPNGQYPTQQVAEMNGSSGMSSRSIRGISTDRNGDRPSNGNRSRSIERQDGIDSDYGRDDDERDAAEAMLELHELGYKDRKMSAIDELQLQREEARSTPQKEELMSVLRARVNNAGGTTTGAQSGLRFKKWVVWNSWHRKSVIPLPAAPARSRPLVSVSSPPASPTLNRSQSHEIILSRALPSSVPIPLTPRPPIVPRTRSLNQLGTTDRPSSSRSFTRISPSSPNVSLPPSPLAPPLRRVNSSSSDSSGDSSSPASSPPSFSPDGSPPLPSSPRYSPSINPALRATNLVKARQFQASYGKGVGIQEHRGRSPEEGGEGMLVEDEAGREGCIAS